MLVFLLAVLKSRQLVGFMRWIGDQGGTEQARQFDWNFGLVAVRMILTAALILSFIFSIVTTIRLTS
jgi:hypothetical protein